MSMVYEDALSLARRAYKEILGRDPEEGAAEQIARRLAEGTYTKEDMYTELLGSEEYFTKIGRSGQQFIKDVYKFVLGRKPEAGVAKKIAPHFMDVAMGGTGDWSRVEYVSQTYESPEYMDTPRDPWTALAEWDEKAGWQQWVIENGWQVNQLWERFTGKTLSNDELTLIASVGEGSAPYLEKIQKFTYWNPAYTAYTKAYGGEPGASVLTDVMGKYKTPEQYSAALKAQMPSAATIGEFSTKSLADIQELMRTEMGRTPTAEEVGQFRRGQVQARDFSLDLEEARRRRAYRWNQVKGTPSFERGPAGLRLADWI